MGQTNFFKIFTILAFLAFASVSCWATAESLHLLLSSIPLVLCWVVTVGFFVIASLGTKMIVDSLNQDVYVDKRGLRLFGGILITLFFWLICIMPTNTHTFFFRNVINDKVNYDISLTQNYLNQIKSNEINETKIKAKSLELRNKVETKLGELKAEIENEANPGVGPKSKQIMNDFAELLGVAKIEPLSSKGASIQNRERLYNAYRNKIFILLDNRLLILVKEMTSSNKKYMEQAENDFKNLDLVKKYIEDGTLDLNDAEDIKSICDKLNAGYATIKSYPQFVDFKNSNDEATYTGPNPVTKVKRLTSVFDVWEDFLKGEYAGHGFIFWVIISVLVDIAAFIFFDITFKKQN
jgi:hypothetical protein